MPQLNYGDMSAISYVGSDVAISLTPLQQSLAIQALALFTTRLMWQDWIENAALIDELVAETLLALETPMTMPFTPDNEVSAWHYNSIVDAGAAITSSIAATVHHGFISLQSPATINDVWKTLNFRLAAGSYVLYLAGQRFTANGIARMSVRRVSDNGEIWNATFDLYAAAATPFAEAFGSFDAVENDYYLHCTLTGKHASSTSYQVRLSLIQLVRVGD